MSIHPTAIVSPEAEIAEDVSIGAYSVILGKVRIGKGTQIQNNVTVGSQFGSVEIGENNQIWTGAFVGGPPQDLKYAGENTQLIIGDNNIIREMCTLNLGTVTGRGITSVGDHNLFMAYTHIAHDCDFANHIAIANSTQFAGHVTIEDHVRIGGMCGVTQFITLGKFSFIAGNSTINKDILPYSIAEGNWATMRATNKIGLDRAGYSKQEIQNIHKALRILIKSNETIQKAVEMIKAECQMDAHIEHLLSRIESSEQGVAR